MSISSTSWHIYIKSAAPCIGAASEKSCSLYVSHGYTGASASLWRGNEQDTSTREESVFLVIRVRDVTAMRTGSLQMSEFATAFAKQFPVMSFAIGDEWLGIQL